jgi:RNA polymerase sigma factor (sigma-70 family)
MNRRDLDDMDDDALLARAGSDPDALETMYRRHVGKTVAFAVRRCRTPEEVHDLVAAIWLEIIGGADRFDPARGRALAWIYGVAAKLVADRRRRAARERQALTRLGGRRVLDDGDVERLEFALDAERISQPLRERVEGLSPAERSAFELVAIDGMDSREAARSLGIEPAALRMRVARARRRLIASLPEAREVER